MGREQREKYRIDNQIGAGPTTESRANFDWKDPTHSRIAYYPRFKRRLDSPEARRKPKRHPEEPPYNPDQVLGEGLTKEQAAEMLLKNDPDDERKQNILRKAMKNMGKTKKKGGSSLGRLLKRAATINKFKKRGKDKAVEEPEEVEDPNNLNENEMNQLVRQLRTKNRTEREKELDPDDGVYGGPQHLRARLGPKDYTEDRLKRRSERIKVKNSKFFKFEKVDFLTFLEV